MDDVEIEWGQGDGTFQFYFGLTPPDGWQYSREDDEQLDAALAALNSEDETKPFFQERQWVGDEGYFQVKGIHTPRNWTTTGEEEDGIPETVRTEIEIFAKKIAETAGKVFRGKEVPGQLRLFA